MPDLPGKDAVTAVDVACEQGPGGWLCRVQVRDGGRAGTTIHEVAVGAADLPRFAPAGSVDVERLVRATFAFLLEREPKESILRRFDLTVVERYFPEFPGEIRRRLTD